MDLVIGPIRDLARSGAVLHGPADGAVLERAAVHLAARLAKVVVSHAILAWILQQGILFEGQKAQVGQAVDNHESVGGRPPHIALKHDARGDPAL